MQYLLYLINLIKLDNWTQIKVSRVTLSLDTMIYLFLQIYIYIYTVYIYSIYIYYVSTFNLMQPHILAHKLIYYFNLENRFAAWIVDFLSCRRQCVFVNWNLEMFFEVDTHMIALVTFADDSALLSLLWFTTRPWSSTTRF